MDEWEEVEEERSKGKGGRWEEAGKRGEKRGREGRGRDEKRRRGRRKRGRERK